MFELYPLQKAEELNTGTRGVRLGFNTNSLPARPGKGRTREGMY